MNDELWILDCGVPSLLGEKMSSTSPALLEEGICANISKTKD